MGSPASQSIGLTTGTVGTGPGSARTDNVHRREPRMPAGPEECENAIRTVVKHASLRRETATSHRRVAARPQPALFCR
jgi:hypothetical protein